MARDLSAGLITAVDSTSLSPVFLIKAEFDGGDLRFWTGYNEVAFNGEIYQGSGELIQLQEVTETQELVANNVDISLNGIPATLVSTALAEDYQGRPISVYFGIFEPSNTTNLIDTWGLIDDINLWDDGDTKIEITNAYLMFKGQMNVMSIEDNGETASILMSNESSLIGLRDSKERRYTDEDQKSEYPNDKGFEFVALSQDVELNWGQGRSD